MKFTVRHILISAQVGAMLATAPMASFAEEKASTRYENFERGAEKTFDLLLLRPLGSIRVVVGMAAMVPVSIVYTLSYPLHSDPGIYGEAAEFFVVEPANFAFRRPLGENLSGE